MKLDIEKLRKKRKWTGKEVGLALLANTLNDIKHVGVEHEPLFSQEEFAKMEKNLKSESDEQVYAVYRSLYSSLLDGYNTGLGLYQQFYNGFCNLFNFMNELKQVEFSRGILARLPLMVTQKQYDDLEEKALKLVKEGKNNGVSVENIILDIATKEKNEQSSHDEISFSGIVVVETKDSSLLDDNGYFIFQDPFKNFSSLKISYEDGEVKESIRSWEQNFIYYAVAYFYAYNTLLVILEECYDIENLSSIARLDTCDIESEVKKFNMSLASFQDNLSGSLWQREEKSKYINDIFNKLTIEELKPVQEDIEFVKQAVNDLGFSTLAEVNLKYFDTFLSMLSKGVV